MQSLNNDTAILLNILPTHVHSYLSKLTYLNEVYEIVLDVGALPQIRYHIEQENNKSFAHSVKCERLKLPIVTYLDIEHITGKVVEFNADNRAGINKTLHRISCLRNRNREVVGLTIRIGRVIKGTIDAIRDLVESGKSLLLLGPPGVGKTTKLREIARVLSENKRVMVVDTSNEIAGEGDIPHEGIGYSRRIQVPSPDKQHAVMIEAVENHMPQVILVDEIGTEEESNAARTIAERGIQLITTAHGDTLENIIKNPTISDLVGGIKSVVLGDDEAKFRGTQKTVLERKKLPAFDCVIEIKDRNEFVILDPLIDHVDAFLRGDFVEPEVRIGQTIKPGTPLNTTKEVVTQRAKQKRVDESTSYLYTYGINKEFLKTAIKHCDVPIEPVKTINEADLVLTTQSKVRGKGKVDILLQGRNMPLHVIKQNNVDNIIKFFKQKFQIIEQNDDIEIEASMEARTACKKVMEECSVIDISPQPTYLRKIQHEIVGQLNLNSMSVGEEPNRRVRIYPQEKGH